MYLRFLVVVLDELEHVGGEAHRDLSERQRLRLLAHLTALLELIPGGGRGGSGLAWLYI